MNIFALSLCPEKCSQYHNSTHVRKQIVEYSQLLANAYTTEQLQLAPRTQKGTVRKYSYIHNPVSKWVLESSLNWQWLRSLASELCREYVYRAGKIHFCQIFVDWTYLNFPAKQFKSNLLTPFYQAMPEDVKNENVVFAYRNYYMKYKRHLADWGKRGEPDWYV
jgi:hypothetical protein